MGRRTESEGVKGERDTVVKKNIDQKTGSACPALGETNGSSSVSSAAYIWCVSLSICACHAPPLPMHDNYPTPECVRWHPASVAAHNFRRQQRLCAGDAAHMGENYMLWMQFGQVLNKKTARLGSRH